MSSVDLARRERGTVGVTGGVNPDTRGYRDTVEFGTDSIQIGKGVEGAEKGAMVCIRPEEFSLHKGRVGGARALEIPTR